VTNGRTDRLDRIENDLETVKDILIAVARRAESTDERLERLAQRTDEELILIGATRAHSTKSRPTK